MICYYLVQYFYPPPPSFLLTWGMGVFQHLFVNFLHLHVFGMNVLRYILLLHVDVLQFYNYVHVLEVSAYGGLVYKGGLKWLIFLVILEVCFVYRSLLIVSTYIHTCFLGIIVFCLALYTSMGFSWPLTSFLGLSSCPLGSFSSTY